MKRRVEVNNLKESLHLLRVDRSVNFEDGLGALIADR